MPGIGERARSTPDATAIVERATAMTFGDLDRRQHLLAGAFKVGNVGVRDRVAVYASNRRELLEVTTGALRCAVIPVPVHTMLTPAEAAYIIEDSGARWLFTDRTIDHLPSLERVVTFGDAYERLLHEAEPAKLADFMLGRPMHYTSGTTGKPKGVWVDPVGDSKAAGISDEFRRLWGLNDEDVHLVCSPLTHSAPHRYAGRTLEAGGTVVVQERFEAEEILAAVELYGISTTFVVPTHLERILALERAALRRYDMSTMRMLIHAGAPIREETKRNIMKLFPQGSVWEFYGSTEGQVTQISPEEWTQKPGSVGKPTQGVALQIVNDEGSDAAPGEIGDIWVGYESDERFSYWGDRRKTEAAWRNGMFTVGDRGFVDDDGYLFLAGRKHDMIISGGLNVYPQEVEAALAAHPAVEEALVYGAPHPEWGQQVSALVVAAFGQPLDPQALTGWLRERLAGFKCPRRIEVVDELPRTPTGKLKRTR